MRALWRQLEARPEATLEEHREARECERGARVPVATMSRTIRRLGWTCKKRRWLAPLLAGLLTRRGSVLEGQGAAAAKGPEARTKGALVEAIGRALDEITPEDARGWFGHCGYAPQGHLF